MRLSLALGLAVSMGAAAACLVDLEERRVCGDAYVDEQAGEECDPAVPASYEGRCLAEGKVARDSTPCDPKDCTLKLENCSLCGNGVVDEGESCDPAAPGRPACLGEGEAICTGQCTIDRSGCAAACGDGKVDANEECDTALGDADEDILCTGLPSPYGGSRPYGGGKTRKCTAGCRWDRSDCNYCGNGMLEDSEEIAVDFAGQVKHVAEKCDLDAEGNTLADKTASRQFCQEEVCGGNFAVECAVGCTADCQGFVRVNGDEDTCCTAKGADCPYSPLPPHDLVDDREPCCWAVAHPSEDPVDSCQTYTNDEQLTFVLCR
ncbi:hypothetical protein [Nannocystis punicea]|uniref:Disintegrin domain-containing protein n=1 Tax=Nannocystis punicea TaxID=2995304 RepID=A0ABY7H8W9_9BACT|nr:hypothetical protein [Nannocystis poenicansa]WAS95708.1 hypothetical protein O0S08_06055 [Nannocystis poenicansa]